jgi:hypothetical protein
MSNVQHIQIRHAFATVLITFHALIPCKNIIYQMRCWNVQITHISLITQQSVHVRTGVNVASETCILLWMKVLYYANKLMTFWLWNQCTVKNNLYYFGSTSRFR